MNYILEFMDGPLKGRKDIYVREISHVPREFVWRTWYGLEMVEDYRYTVINGIAWETQK